MLLSRMSIKPFGQMKRFIEELKAFFNYQAELFIACVQIFCY